MQSPSVSLCEKKPRRVSRYDDEFNLSPSILTLHWLSCLCKTCLILTLPWKKIVSSFSLAWQSTTTPKTCVWDWEVTIFHSAITALNRRIYFFAVVQSRKAITGGHGKLKLGENRYVKIVLSAKERNRKISKLISEFDRKQIEIRRLENRLRHGNWGQHVLVINDKIGKMSVSDRKEVIRQLIYVSQSCHFFQSAK